MSWLDHLGQAAAVILLLELLVVLLIFAGISGGLAWGLHWVRGKTDWAFEKVNRYTQTAVRLVHRGTDLVGRPFVLGAALAANVRGTGEALREMVRSDRERRSLVAARPVPPDPDLTTANPLVGGVTPAAEDDTAAPLDIP